MHTKVQYKCTIKQQMKILKNITCALNASLVQKKKKQSEEEEKEVPTCALDVFKILENNIWDEL